MKWDIIKKEWEYREPTRLCNWSHRFTSGAWKDGLYFPDEKNCICTICHTWWAKWHHNRRSESMPPMFNAKGEVNEPFYYIEGEAGVKANPEYTYGEYRKWLNGKGVALKRERYPYCDD